MRIGATTVIFSHSEGFSAVDVPASVKPTETPMATASLCVCLFDDTPITQSISSMPASQALCLLIFIAYRHRARNATAKVIVWIRSISTLVPFLYLSPELVGHFE